MNLRYKQLSLYHKLLEMSIWYAMCKKPLRVSIPFGDIKPLAF